MFNQDAVHTIRLRFAQPDWWEQLPEQHRNTLVQRMMTSIDPAKPRFMYCLRSDGVNAMYPAVRSRRAVGFTLREP